MTEPVIIRLVVALGCYSGAYGLSQHWWVGAMGGALAWVYPNSGTIAMATFLAIFAVWSFLARRFPRRPGQRTREDDVIDAEFEVRNG